MGIEIYTTISRLERLCDDVSRFVTTFTGEDFSLKPSEDKWSKKEILGHLVDSGVHNLQRFTEIQFSPEPYKIRKYMQDELVKANDYQHADIQDILRLFISLNRQILRILRLQTSEALQYKILLDNGKISDFRFLIDDYVEHMEHHLRQFMR